MIEGVENLDLSHCALAVSGVLERADFLNGYFLSSPFVVGLPVWYIPII
jgi:hypothetical protein